MTWDRSKVRPFARRPPKNPTAEIRVLGSDLPGGLQEAKRIADAIDREDPPHLVPDARLQRTVATLMDVLIARRDDFRKYDPTGRLKSSFERFRCDLRRSGFRVP